MIPVKIVKYLPLLKNFKMRYCHSQETACLIKKIMNVIKKSQWKFVSHESKSHEFS